MYLIRTVFLALLLCLSLFGCSNDSVKEDRQSSPEQTLDEAIDLYLNSYPQQEFGDDMARQIAMVVGKEVTESAREELKFQMSKRDVRELRKKFLLENFTKEEIGVLASIYSSENGRSLMRKMPNHRKAWQEFLQPYILDQLTNSAEAPE